MILFDDHESFRVELVRFGPDPLVVGYGPHVNDSGGAGRDEVLAYVGVLDGKPGPGEEGAWWVQS
ncbi:hypothetical protein TorRG33x02_212270 [Trema orientale]|uniref:Uncharacterized protein n=1 Tax=Trema orientale TaxID=63057 RepID=A0A2P5EBU7_TREOI|nr:hypothetical protein TorRG33x02_212270 [Trema orientale]